MAPRAPILLGLLLVAWTAVPASPGTGTTAAVCVGQHRVRFDPGITMTEGRSTLSTRDGRITCRGRIGGRDVTGLEGTFRQGGALVGDCSGGVLAGTMSLMIPTEGEPTTLTMAYQGTYGPAIGSQTSERATVSFEFHPVEGDCVTTPLTTIEAGQQIVLER